MGVTKTEDLLEVRKSTHGEYSEHARCTQRIMRALMAERNWPNLTNIQLESLHMFAHKMGRIVTGDPNVHDHWDDIAGYAVLVSQRLPLPAPTRVVSIAKSDERKTQWGGGQDRPCDTEDGA